MTITQMRRLEACCISTLYLLLIQNQCRGVSIIVGFYHGSDEPGRCLELLRAAQHSLFPSALHCLQLIRTIRSYLELLGATRVFSELLGSFRSYSVLFGATRSMSHILCSARLYSELPGTARECWNCSELLVGSRSRSELLGSFSSCSDGEVGGPDTNQYTTPAPVPLNCTPLKAISPSAFEGLAPIPPSPKPLPPPSRLKPGFPACLANTT